MLNWCLELQDPESLFSFFIEIFITNPFFLKTKCEGYFSKHRNTFKTLVIVYYFDYFLWFHKICHETSSFSKRGSMTYVSVLSHGFSWAVLFHIPDSKHWWVLETRICCATTAWQYETRQSSTNWAFLTWQRLHFCLWDSMRKFLTL